MVAGFDERLWDDHVLTGLEAARNVAALRRRVSAEAQHGVAGSAVEDEEEALRGLADQPLFASVHPALQSKVHEGQWIMTRIFRAADALRAELPSHRPRSEWPTAQKAILLWA